jgi:hypothetical protein
MRRVEGAIYASWNGLQRPHARRRPPVVTVRAPPQARYVRADMLRQRGRHIIPSAPPISLWAGSISVRNTLDPDLELAIYTLPPAAFAHQPGALDPAIFLR